MSQESQYISQELEYLRDEINQSLKLLDEHPQKTIHMVLLIWGGILILLGAKQTIFDDITLCFLLGTIFFFSNLILYFSAQEAHENMDGIAKIAAYIIVFYEKRPSKTVKVGVDKNISWEIANMEFESYVKDPKPRFKRNREYIVLMILSTLAILVSTIMFSQICELKETFEIFRLLISGFYFFASLWLLYKTQGLLKSFYDVRKKHLKAFFQYSLNTGHYTKEEIEERFGDFWRKIDAKKA